MSCRMVGFSGDPTSGPQEFGWLTFPGHDNRRYSASAKLRRPWFKTLNGSEGGGVGTQDLYFWVDARKYGYRCAVDCNVLVGHYDINTDTTW